MLKYINNKVLKSSLYGAKSQDLSFDRDEEGYPFLLTPKICIDQVQISFG